MLHNLPGIKCAYSGNLKNFRILKHKEKGNGMALDYSSSQGLRKSWALLFYVILENGGGKHKKTYTWQIETIIGNSNTEDLIQENWLHRYMKAEKVKREGLVIKR